MYPGGNPNFDEMRDPSLPGGPGGKVPGPIMTHQFLDQNQDGIDDRKQQLQQNPDGTWSRNFIGVGGGGLPPGWSYGPQGNAMGVDWPPYIDENGNKQWNLPGNQNPYQTPGQPQIDPRMLEILMGQLPGGQW